jgi:hypothetical protein
MNHTEQLAESQPQKTKKQPLISFIIPARNDGHMGNFNWRLETVLNYLADNLQKLGRLDDLEVVVGDWGSEEPLYKILSLTPTAKKIARFVLVPPDLALEKQADSVFPIVLIQNTAIRRCRGKFIAQTDSDILFTAKFLENLFEILEGKQDIGIPVEQALLYSSRCQVPWKYASSSPPINELDWFVRNFGSFLRIDPDHGLGFCGTGMVMMPRNLWDESSCFDEKLIYWGWMEIDLGFRITQKYPGFNLTDRGLMLFHLEHFRPETERKTTRKKNPIVRDNVFRPNGDDWGLANYSLEEFTYPEEASSAVVKPQAFGMNWKLLPMIVWVVLAKFGRAIILSLPEPLRPLYVNSKRWVFAIWKSIKGSKSVTQ